MNKFVILGHENPDFDSIVSGYILEKIMKKHGYNAEFLIPDKQIEEENIKLSAYIGIDPTSFQKTLPEDKAIKYILVDHHERDVPGEIISIIDHHPTDKAISCKHYQNQAACSTSCIIGRGNERQLSCDDIKAICLSAMVDTAGFHSNKTKLSDYLWIKYLCEKYKFNYQELINMAMLPTDIEDLKKASLNGLKTYNINDQKIASSYIHVSNPSEKETEINTMCMHIQEHIITEEYDLFAFIVHDITNFKTTLYKITATETEITQYDEYTSRGSKIIPDITKSIKNPQKKKTIETQ